jgi:hypothetical protein
MLAEHAQCPYKWHHLEASCCAPHSPIRQQRPLLFVCRRAQLLVALPPETAWGPADSEHVWVFVNTAHSMELTVLMARAAAAVVVGPCGPDGSAVPSPRVWRRARPDPGDVARAQLAWAVEHVHALLTMSPDPGVPPQLPTDSVHAAAICAHDTTRFHALLLQPPIEKDVDLCARVPVKVWLPACDGRVVPCAAVAVFVAPAGRWLVSTPHRPGRLVAGSPAHIEWDTLARVDADAGTWSSTMTLTGVPALRSALAYGFGRDGTGKTTWHRLVRQLQFVLRLERSGCTPSHFAATLDDLMTTEFGNHDPQFTNMHLPAAYRETANGIDDFLETLDAGGAFTAACAALLPLLPDGAAAVRREWLQAAAWHALTTHLAAQPEPFASTWLLTVRRLYCRTDAAARARRVVSAVPSSEPRAIETGWRCYDGIGSTEVPFTSFQDSSDLRAPLLEPEELAAGQVPPALARHQQQAQRGPAPALLRALVDALLVPPPAAGERALPAVAFTLEDVCAAVAAAGIVAVGARARILAATTPELVPPRVLHALVEQLAARVPADQVPPHLRCRIGSGDRLLTWHAPHPVVTCAALDTFEWLSLCGVHRLVRRTARTLMHYLVCATGEDGRDTCVVLAVRRDAPPFAPPRTKFGVTATVEQRFPAPPPGAALWSFDRFETLLRRAHAITRFYIGSIRTGAHAR